MQETSIKDVLLNLSRRQTAAMTAVGIGLIVASSLAWWFFVYQSPYRVFWGMVGNSMRTQGVTRHMVQKNGSTVLDQTLTNDFGATALVQAKTQLQQPGSTVTTQTIGAKDAEFVRYTSIVSDEKGADGKPKQFGSVLNKWAKTDAKDDLNNPGLLEQSVFGLAGGNIVPMANLSKTDQAQLMGLLRNSLTFDTSFKGSDVQRKSVNGRPAFEYKVKVQAVAYAGFEKALAQKLGLTLFKDLDPNDYQGQAPIAVLMDVDIWSHRLVGVTYVGQDRTETYSGYGIVHDIALPKATLSSTQLQQSIQGLQ